MTIIIKYALFANADISKVEMHNFSSRRKLKGLLWAIYTWDDNATLPELDAQADRQGNGVTNYLYGIAWTKLYGNNLLEDSTFNYIVN